MNYERKLECPHCGYKSGVREFLYMYEATLYLVNSEVEKEERERPILVICPRCGQGFFLEDPYSKIRYAALYKA